MLVILDSAHGSNVSGKCSPDGRLREYLWSREIVGRLEQRLDDHEIPHARSCPELVEPGLTTRCKRANLIAKSHKGKGGCVFVSPHVNAAGNGTWKNARGWSVFVSNSASSNSKKLAALMTTAARIEGIKVRVPDPQHAYWSANFTVLTKTSMPAVLVENMFQDNKEDVEYLLSEQGKSQLTEIMVRGICDYFGVKYKPISIEEDD